MNNSADVGGLQFQVYPMSAEAYFQKQVAARLPRSLSDLVDDLVTVEFPSMIMFSRAMDCRVNESGAMGLGAGGTMRQEIYEDPNDFADWDQSMSSRCFIHLCSLVWRQITGANPPHPPLTAREYVASVFPGSTITVTISALYRAPQSSIE